MQENSVKTNELEKNEEGVSEVKTTHKKSKKKLIIFIVVIVIIALFGAYAYKQMSKYQSTDDAFISGNPINIASNVSGHITSISVVNNQYVQKGQLLLTIDSRGYKTNVQAVQAQISGASAQVAALQAKISAQGDSVKNSEKTVARLEKLSIQDAVSQQDVDNAVTNLQVAQKTLQGMQSDLQAQQDNVKVLQAQLSNANLNVSYTNIYAPFSGYITMSSVQVGDFVQSGSPIFALVTTQMWISANFKETQMGKIKVGDKVDITLDAVPGVIFKGTVQSTQAGTGSVFSLLPPENATGNFVKVVQRVPVNITFDDPSLIQKYHIGLGLSVVAKVYVNTSSQNQSGITSANQQFSVISAETQNQASTFSVSGASN
ncbi:MAG: HlyD family secretion protein [Fusobacteria bacterium]|nr:HlyD family secretion protein [Fusobacteriota bacterium]